MTPAPEKDWRPVFLDMFAKTGNVRLSCYAAGISRTHAYRERMQNRDFAAAWAAADEDATDALEAEARRRALATSDTLLMFLLKARRPQIYREAQGAVVNEGPSVVVVGRTPRERRILDFNSSEDWDA